jgi:hypothetical protein
MARIAASEVATTDSISMAADGLFSANTLGNLQGRINTRMKANKHKNSKGLNFN